MAFDQSKEEIEIMQQKIWCIHRWKLVNINKDDVHFNKCERCHETVSGFTPSQSIIGYITN
jgi:hypothetical protein